MTLAELKKNYGDLKKGRVHSHDCGCVSCLYYYMKLKNKDCRIDKDIFFLYWLAFCHAEKKEKARNGVFLLNEHLQQNWKEILGLYDEITSRKGRRGGDYDNIIERKYPDRSDLYRIISKYDKKYNISKLSNLKSRLADRLHISISPLLLETERILDCIRRTVVHTPPAYFPPKDILLEFNNFTKKALKIAVLLNKAVKKEKINMRFLSRKFQLSKKDLTVILDYLEQKHILVWDKETNEIVLGYEGMKATIYYIDWIEVIRESLNSVFPFSIEMARRAFIERAYS